MSDINTRLQNSFVRNEALYLGIIALTLFMIGIWNQPFINFETRFAVFAQEMIRNGPTLFPTTYGQPYPDYPVTSTVLIWFLSLPFGEVSKFSAVMPTAFASAIVIVLTYKLFAQYSRQWGVFAICFEFLTLSFVAEARSISVDQMLSAITLAAFYLTNKSHHEGSALPTRSLLLLLLAGFLIRGPIGVVIPAGVVISHLVLTSGRREVITFATFSAGVLLACSATLLGSAMLCYGTNFVSDIVKMQAVSRFSESIPSPMYYYFTSSFGNYALSYPIAMLVALTAVVSKFRMSTQKFNKDHAELILLLAAWIGIVLIGLSIPETKKSRYILPIIPALAGLASYVFISADYQMMKWLRRCVELVLIALPLLAAFLVYAQKTRVSEAGIEFVYVIVFLCAIFIINIIILVIFKFNKQKIALCICVSGAMTAYLFQIFIVETIDLNIHDTSHFVRRIESLREERPGRLVFYKENPDGLPIKYLVNAKKELLPLFINMPDKLKNDSNPIWLLTRDENIEELRKAGIDTDSVNYHENFAKTPFSAIFIPAHSPEPELPSPTPAKVSP